MRSALHRIALVGDMDLVRPLGLAGIRCAVVTRPWSAAWASRFARARIPWTGPKDTDGFVQALLDFAATQEAPPEFSRRLFTD